jgi:hypothetical protein
MMNISTTHSVSWPSPASAQVAAVSAVEGVRPVQDGRRSGQPSPDAQTPQGGQRHHKDVSTPEAGRVPLLPRQSGGDGDRSGRIAVRSEAADDGFALREAGQHAEQLEAEKAEAQTRREQLKAALSEVWKASAAVVDRVLGRDEDALRSGQYADGAAGVDPMSGAGTSMALKLPAPEPLPWPVMPKEPAFAVPGRATAAEAVPVHQEVVAYDEHGNSSLAPLETGVLVDQRV